jgi:hypothetical protein
MGLRELATRLRESITGQPTLIAEWYRKDPAMNSHINSLLDAAAGRPEFNAAAIRVLQQEHLSGRANNIHQISAITTAESWLQQYLE